MRQGICILGSTGSIGQNTLEVINLHPESFQVIALGARQSVEALFEQCVRFKPLFAVLENPEAAAQLRLKISAQGLETSVLAGKVGLETVARLPEVSIVIAAIVGSAGLMSTLAAVESGKRLLLANKESLVMIGDLLFAVAKKSGAVLLPVDSEHNALFQCMPPGYRTGERPEAVVGITLTASGGPFLHREKSAFKSITPAMACEHPNWKMGKKITVDCATLMNKGLEVIEACRLFQLTSEEVSVVIHPQSIIHSLVEYVDGSQLAQLGSPDMRIPISTCLSWPHRIPSNAKRLDLTQIGQLTFFPPDRDKFKCLELAYAALNLKRAAPTVLNASNEIAVQAFLNDEMRFSDIPDLIEDVLQALYDLSADSVQDVLWADQRAREQTRRLIAKKSYTMSVL